MVHVCPLQHMHPVVNIGFLGGFQYDHTLQEISFYGSLGYPVYSTCVCLHDYITLMNFYLLRDGLFNAVFLQQRPHVILTHTGHSS